MNHTRVSAPQEEGVTPFPAEGGEINNKKPTKMHVLMNLYQYADASLETPIFEDIASRLNAYLIVDALLIALLVTLLPIPRSELVTAFTWTEEDMMVWNSSSFASIYELADLQTSLNSAVTAWVVSIVLLINSFCFALFTYVQLLGVKKSKLIVWYQIFTKAVTISLWSLIFGLITFFWSCAYWVQIMGGAKGLVMFISAFIGIFVPIVIFAVAGPFITGFINAGVW